MKPFIVEIDGREAVPVRAVAYLTGWHLPPDRLVEALAHRGRASVKLFAYRLATPHVPMLPKAWDECQENLKLLTKLFMAGMGYTVAEVEREGTKELPPGVFVWKSDLDAAWRDGQGPLALLELQGEHPARFGDDDYSQLPDELLALVMEGFVAEREAAPISGTKEKAAPTVQVVTPMPRQRFQEAEILRVVSELGYSAKALPKSPPGKKGPKSEVRAKLDMTAGVFDLAWERLRSQGDIQDAKKNPTPSN